MTHRKRILHQELALVRLLSRTALDHADRRAAFDREAELEAELEAVTSGSGAADFSRRNNSGVATAGTPEGSKMGTAGAELAPANLAEGAR